MNKRLIFIDDNPVAAEKFRDRVIRTWQMPLEVIPNNSLKPAQNTEKAREEFCDDIVNFVKNYNDGSIEAIILDVFFDFDGSESKDPLGYELGRKLRANFPTIPIILYTVNEKMEDSLNAFNFDGYIVKTKFLAGEIQSFASTLTLAKQRRDRVLEECESLNNVSTRDSVNPVILHISDIHRGLQSATDDNENLFEGTCASLERDIENYSNEDISTPNIIVVSGDITRKGSIEGYPIAKKFIRRIAEKLKIPKDQIVICPGNHDLDRKISKISYGLNPLANENDQPTMSPNEYYKFRFAPFKSFFDDFYEGKHVYSLEDNEAFTIFDYSTLFNLVIVAFNSCEKTDHIVENRNKSYISLDTIKKAKEKLIDLELGSYIKIAVWHHPVIVEYENNLNFHDRVLQELFESSFIFYLHGHAHSPENRPYSTNQSNRKVYQWGAGTIGVSSVDRPEDIPRHYEIISFDYSKRSYTVHSRQRLGIDWKPCPSFLRNKSSVTKKIPKTLLK